MHKVTTKHGNPEISEIHSCIELHLKVQYVKAKRIGKSVEDDNFLLPQAKKWKYFILSKTVAYTATIFR